MNIENTQLAGILILTPTIFEDDRGYFFESYNQKGFHEALGLDIKFVQDNQSLSYYGVIRGLHFQKGAMAQGKLVRVIKGEVFDVVVDLRPESKTFGKWAGFHISETNQKQLWIPAGFAHGFSVLSPDVILSYKCDNYYDKEMEAGINPFDEQLGIDWKIPEGKRILSPKDLQLPRFNELSFHS